MPDPIYAEAKSVFANGSMPLAQLALNCHIFGGWLPTSSHNQPSSIPITQAKCRATQHQGASPVLLKTEHSESNREGRVSGCVHLV